MPSSLPPALQHALIALAARLDAAGVDWVIAGSAARALAGFAVIPRDLDVELDEADVPRAAAAVGLEAGRAIDERGGSLRAVGQFAAQEVDLTGGLTLRGPGGVLAADFPLVRRFTRPINVAGHEVPVAPVEEQIARATVLGDAGRLDRIAREAPPGYARDETYLALRLAAASAAR